MKLAEDYKALEEVVVVGYGTMLKRNLSTSVGSVDSEKLLERPNATNVFQGLAGKVAGVNINASSSGVGGATRVVMRGTKSISSDNNALYVIDGVPMFNVTSGSADGGTMSDQPGTNSVADINPEDIEV